MARTRPIEGRPAAGSDDPGVLRAYAALYASLADDEDIAEEQDWSPRDGYTNVLRIIRTTVTPKFDPDTGRQIRSRVREDVDGVAVSSPGKDDGLELIVDELLGRRP